MGNPKKFKRLCTESYWNTIEKAGGNKGKQMQDQTGKQPIVDNG